MIPNSTILRVFLVTMVIVVITTAYSVGHRNGVAKTELEVSKLIDEHNKKIIGIQEELYDTERAWLEQETKVEIIENEKVVEVTRYVKKYVKDNSLDKCVLDTAGMQLVNDTINDTNKIQ